MKPQPKGVLLVNLGTPDSPEPKDVKKYLLEFLTDGRVIDSSWLVRQLLVRGIIVPRRYKDSAQNYQRVWTSEGSPLLFWGRKAQELLQAKLGDEYQVELAMRYQSPSLTDGLRSLQDCSELIILPLFPQYASATTGSVHQEVMRILSKWQTIPQVTFLSSFPTQPKMIAAFAEQATTLPLPEYDHVVFSFHGLPERQLRKADRNQHCLQNDRCCRTLTEKNRDCYSAQCWATAQAIANQLAIPEENYTICYQSRLGNDPWIQPYASDVLERLAKEGKQNLLVFSPAFICDCLETTDEIGVEYRKEFLAMGGKRLDLVPGLNDHPLWIEAMEEMVRGRKSKWHSAIDNCASAC